VVETDSVHQKRTARLAAELGPERSGGLGHEPQHERRIVAWRAGTPDGFLDRGDELVEGEIFRAPIWSMRPRVAAPRAVKVIGPRRSWPPGSSRRL
jgi:hypothetical protein